MNREQTLEHIAELERRIEVERGFVDGRKVQCVDRATVLPQWVAAPSPSWDWVHYDYRLAPEPIVMYAIIRPGWKSTFVNKESARRALNIGGGRLIRLVEDPTFDPDAE